MSWKHILHDIQLTFYRHIATEADCSFQLNVNNPYLHPQVASKYPSSVTMCNLDLEHLISDSNRSIATLAITTLLKTGNEGSIERLMKQIQSFMSEIPDEFKIIVVKAIQSLCIKFPNKHDIMINLCSTMLREEVLKGFVLCLLCDLREFETIPL